MSFLIQSQNVGGPEHTQVGGYVPNRCGGHSDLIPLSPTCLLSELHGKFRVERQEWRLWSSLPGSELPRSGIVEGTLSGISVSSSVNGGNDRELYSTKLCVEVRVTV